MQLDQIIVALDQLRSMVAQQGIVSGSIPHVIGQLEDLVRGTQAGLTVRLEERVTATISQQSSSIIGFMREEVVKLTRFVDSAVKETGADTERKTHQTIGSLLSEATLKQLFFDVIKNSVGGRESTVKMDNITLTPENRQKIEGDLELLFHRMISERFSPMLLHEGFERLQFVDEAGKAFRPALKQIFGPDGPITIIALEEASHSPNFHPAMEALFGASGKLAGAAHDAATGANLGPALQPFEEKVEDGVKTALDKAGDESKAHAASALGSKVGEGARSLGNILTAVPQLYDSVKQLGDVWKQPLDSTEAYMKLFSSLGGVVNQGTQAIEALAGVTKIASAAQAIFNAIMAMNPVVLIVLAVIALIAVIVLLIVYWDQVKAALRDNPWLAVAAVLFGVIGIIIVIIAYWDEIKLAVLIAANFISIQVQTIGAFFVGLGRLIGMVWDFIVATAANVGISIVNFFITAGTQIENFFIGLVNSVLKAYNAIAGSVIGDILGLSKADLIPEVDVQSRLIPPKDVPTIDVNAAFKPAGEIKGGLEGAIADQQGVVAAGEKADADRRAKEAAAAQQPPAAPASPALPPGLPPGAGVPGAGGLPPRPDLPPGAGAPPAGGGGGGGVQVEGGIVININAERMELDAVEAITDEFVQQLKAKLDALQTTADFRTGTR
jgi:hypothetical protein